MNNVVHDLLPPGVLLGTDVMSPGGVIDATTAIGDEPSLWGYRDEGRTMVIPGRGYPRPLSVETTTSAVASDHS